MRTRGLKLRLRTMMFLQFFLNGTTLPIFSLYLKDFLHFSGTQAGLIIGMSAASSFVSPFLATLVADRLLRSERLYGLCHAIGGSLMLILSLQHRFVPVLVVYLIYILVYGPTNALTNIITLHHQPDAARRFGGIRLWGTVGWVAVAWLFGFFWLRGGGGTHVPERLPDALKLSTIVSFALALYSLTLPRSPASLLQRRSSGRRANPAAGAVTDAGLRPRGRLFPREALKVLSDPQVALFLVVSFLVYSMDTYFYFGAALFLSSLRVASGSIMPLLSIGQLVEIGVMALLGILLARFGFRTILIGGVLMEMMRFLLLCIGAPFAVVVIGLASHGLCYGLFFGTAPIFLDSRSTISSRPGVQQLFTIATIGLGAFIGNLTAGRIFDAVTAHGIVPGAFRTYWLVPATVALVVVTLMLVGFRDSRRPALTGERSS